MSNLRQSLDIEAKIIKHYIKDLSFENLQDINNQIFKEDEIKFSDNISAIFQTYNEKNFSVLLKFTCDCSFPKPSTIVSVAKTELAEGEVNPVNTLLVTELLSKVTAPLTLPVPSTLDIVPVA